MAVPGFNYKPIMYDEACENNLRTGDVIELRVADFEKICRHDSMLNLLKEYEQNPDYPKSFWAVLNQPCDMVHDTANKRYFKSNLFLAPLQGVKSALRKGTLGGPRLNSNIKDLKKIIVENFEKFIHEDKDKKSLEFLVGRIKDILEVEDKEAQHPSDLLAFLIEYLDRTRLTKDLLIKFEKGKVWKQALENYDKELREPQKIRINNDLKDKLSKLCLNQLDSQGFFFYEPHENFYFPTEGKEICYIIQLEDMITLKIKKDYQSSGQLVEDLKNKRVVSLTENFSDRLLNIMGIYFSKIATKNVLFHKVMELYNDVCPDEFEHEPKQVKKRSKNKKRPASVRG